MVWRRGGFVCHVQRVLAVDNADRVSNFEWTTCLGALELKESPYTEN